MDFYFRKGNTIINLLFLMKFLIDYIYNRFTCLFKQNVICALFCSNKKLQLNSLMLISSLRSVCVSTAMNNDCFLLKQNISVGCSNNKREESIEATNNMKKRGQLNSLYLEFQREKKLPPQTMNQM